MAHITELWIYPIKSCQGIPLSKARLVPGGIEGDRRYMVIDAAGQFVTARTEPRLLAVRTELNPQGSELSVFCEGHLQLSFPLQPQPQVGSTLEGRVWRDVVRVHEHAEGSKWFSSVLGRSVRLVYQPETALRQVNPERAKLGDVVSLADGYPLLLTNQASLDELSDRVGEPLDMRRFRPNVVVSHERAFAEDTWETISLGGLHFEVPKLCDRCVMTTVDPDTLQKSKEPLRTLALYRKWQGAVWFGANLIGRSSGTLRIGDVAQVLSEREHPSRA